MLCMTTCWVLTDGKMGCRRQALGLVKALGWTYVEKKASRRKPWYWLPPHWYWGALKQCTHDSDPLESPWPDWIIGCGYRSIPISLAIRHASAGKTRCIHVQNPRINPRHFDWVIAAEHDHLKGANVITHLGALNDISTTAIDEACQMNQHLTASLTRPCCAVIIGGDTKQYRMNEADIEATLAHIQSIEQQWPGSMIILSSRRTPASLRQGIVKQCENKSTLRHFGPDVPNGYFTALGIADCLIVSNDSSSMISECCSTGKPVYIINLPGLKNKKKINELIESLMINGYCRIHKDRLETWAYTPLQESQKVAEALLKQM